MLSSPTRASIQSHSRALAGAILVSAFWLSSAATLVLFLMVHVSSQMGGNRDFVVYWATGRQLVQHHNPYDRVALALLEHAAGLPQKYSVGYTRNPPWALPLVYPLGFLSLRAAAILASLVLIAALVASVRILLRIYGVGNVIVQALAYLFAPALICLVWGQTSLLVLLGLALFLRFHTERPFVAGAALWLCMLKPHLLLPLAVVLLAWIVITRNYRILAGAAAALIASAALTLLLDPQAFTQYAQMMSSSGYERDPIPAISVLLRTRLTPNFMPLQFVPVAVATVWAIVYFWRRRRTWEWPRDGNLLLLVSLVASPYAYLNDHLIALPAIMYAASRTASRTFLAVIALASAVLEVAFLVNKWSPAPFYWATLLAAPLWLVWYGFAARRAA